MAGPKSMHSVTPNGHRANGSGDLKALRQPSRTLMQQKYAANGHEHFNHGTPSVAGGAYPAETPEDESYYDELLQSDPIAISGMACRLPGGVSSPSEFWNMLMQQRSGQCKVPKDRFNADGFYWPDGDFSGSMNCMGGYFLQEDVRQFENNFFGINNLEATYMDPQQRKLLEVVYECFESAGLTLEDVAGSNTGVYVGNFTVDYLTMQTRDPEYLHRYSATGSGTAILANRISHVFDLRGPSFALDTACSASVYCLHNAVQAIKNGECDAAIVAGANLIMAPEQHLGTSKGGVLSPDSTCYTFDSRANGYGRGEAVSALYVTKLSDALDSNTPVRCVIRGTAINANGKTPGITQPSIQMQGECLEKAYRLAGLDLALTDYVEAHGTGTNVGDPMEAEGLSRVIAKVDRAPLLVGANKPNVGHSEAASGITAIIKVILAFENDIIPPTRGIEVMNPKLKLDEWNMDIVTKATKWPSVLKRAGVNSFGYGGANAHVILEAFEKSKLEGGELGVKSPANPLKEYIFPLSGSSVSALESRAAGIGEKLRQGRQYDYDDLCYTLSKKRTRLGKPGYILSRPSTGAADFTSKSIVQPKQALPNLPIAFVFTGQGAQWAQMGKELLESNSIFAEAIQDLDDVLAGLEGSPSWTLRSALEDAATDVADARFSQPLCTAVQIGLVKMLRAWGISPTAVVGHSSGEMAAAYTAGLLSEGQAIAAAYYRGYTSGQITKKGQMLAAGLGVDAALEMIGGMGLYGKATVACVNAPDSVTISGDYDAVTAIKAALEEKGTFNRAVNTGGRAYHSHLMKEIGAEYERLTAAAFARLPRPRTGDGSIKFYSSVGDHGEELGVFDKSSTHFMKASYWRRNLENPVQFNKAVAALLEAEDVHLVEVGPHPAMKGPVKSIKTSIKKDKTGAEYFTTLSRNTDGDRCMKELAGGLFFAGQSVDFVAVNDIPYDAAQLNTIPDLPQYKWTYDTLLWNECRSSQDLRNREYVRHELLGSRAIAENGVDALWRNPFKLDEVPWIGDHKLESQVVFPGAGYLAMAVEAIGQVKGISANDLTQRPTIKFREVNIAAALVVNAGEPLEIMTTLSPTKLSKAVNSKTWYDFTISSVKGSSATVNCTGSISLHTNTVPAKTTIVEDSDYEQWKMKAWYEKLAFEGLEFGPTFQTLTSMRTDKARTLAEAVSTTPLVHQVAKPHSKHPGTYYAVHPLVIDACLQAAIMGGTAGKLNTLKAHLPVFIGNMELRGPGAVHSDEESKIATRSRSTGFTSKVITATLTHNDESLIDMTGVRLSEYGGKTDQGAEDARHPCLRVIWKPDVTRFDGSNIGALDDYINKYISEQKTLDSDPILGKVGAILDLAGHKNPRLRVLELGTGSNTKSESWLMYALCSWQELLDCDNDFPKAKDWHLGTFNEDSALQVAPVSIASSSSSPSYAALKEGQQFDAIVMVNKGSTAGVNFGAVADALSPRGIFVVKTSELPKHTREIFAQRDLLVLDSKSGLTLVIAPAEHRDLSGKDIVIVKPEGEVPVEKELLAAAPHVPGINSAKSYTLKELAQADVNPDTAVYVSLLELDQELLCTIDQPRMDELKKMTNTAKDLIWVTGQSTLTGDQPDLSLSSGLSRAMMLEQPATRFVVLDVGKADKLTPEQRSYMIHTIGKTLITNDEPDDKEFVLHNNVLHVSRFLPDKALNSLFDQRMKHQPKEMTLAEVAPAKLSIQKIGMMDTIYFQQETVNEAPVELGHLEIDVKAVSLNAKDIYVLSGKVETQKGTSAIEFSGIVKRVAKDVSDFAPGDRVVVLAPNNFRTTETVPAWACQKMLPSESFEVMPTLPVIYGTALYALDDRANLRKGESILVHSGAGAFGYATLALAILRGAIPYATIGTDSKRDFLVQSLGIPPENIFSSRDESFVDDVLKATKGRGVDVVVNSLVGDLLHATWRCVSPFGRFVEVGKKDIVEAGKLDMTPFFKNVTFTAFDLTELYYHPDEHYRNIWTNKMKEALELYRAKKVHAVPIRSFDVSDIAQAYRFFNNRSRVGKVVISMQDPESIIRGVPARYTTQFSPDKSYLLVGCLGGLGRSVSKWMFDRGARNFSFLGRSGADKPSAASLVQSLEKRGAKVTIVRGDSAKKEAIDRLVNTAPLPVGGVIHAAMGLHEAIFSVMPCDAWQTGIQPKWRGAWNLHESLQGKDDQLDFFLMTSSVSGSVGTATESNYCAANGFLDAFARYRRSIGKPAVSIGYGMISEVGYLHENPEIEALLLRKGIQPLNEEEMLQVMDYALSIKGSCSGMEYDPLAEAHILTGLEPHGIKKLMDQGFDVNNNGTMKEPRAILLAASLDKSGADDGAAGAAIDASWSKGLPGHLVKALAPVAAQSGSLSEAIFNLVARSFSNLLLIPREKVDPLQSVSSVGMDSMIASEFRSWFFNAFQVDIPFLTIMDPKTTLTSLAANVEEKIAV